MIQQLYCGSCPEFYKDQWTADIRHVANLIDLSGVTPYVKVQYSRIMSYVGVFHVTHG